MTGRITETILHGTSGAYRILMLADGNYIYIGHYRGTKFVDNVHRVPLKQVVLSIKVSDSEVTPRNNFHPWAIENPHKAEREMLVWGLQVS
jgi:hypothetical protein